jgi:glycerol uptake facilitator-like aquaporin
MSRHRSTRYGIGRGRSSGTGSAQAIWPTPGEGSSDRRNDSVSVIGQNTGGILGSLLFRLTLV